MQLQMLWFALAGFVLGFTASTLWEWLYYRRQRLIWREPLRYVPVAPANAPEISAFEEELPNHPTTPNEVTTEYRSPGVFLESEQRPVLHYPPTAEPVTTLTPEVWSAAWEAERSYPPPPSASTAAALPAWEPVRTAPAGAYRAARSGAPRYSPEELPPEELSAAAAPPEAIVSEEIPTLPAADSPELTPQPPTAASTPVPGVVVSGSNPVLVVELAAVVPPIINPPPTPVEGNAHDPEIAAQPALSPVPQADEALAVGSASIPLRRPIEHPDDLGRIDGIGEIYKQRLFAAGIYTWQQVVDSDAERLRQITRAKPNVDIDDWQSQAQALVKQFNRGGATYNGPTPEDLALIEGIGPVVREVLYKAGITTFARLAATTPAELAVILPAPAVGIEFHFADWIAQAAQRAQHPAAQAR